MGAQVDVGNESTSRVAAGATDHDGRSDHLALENVTKRFSDFVAVENLDLAIRSGEFISLLGPSGCGKTTTLRMLGGFEEPTSGRILLDGVEITGLPPYRRDINTVFQSYALFPHLDVWENIAYGLKRKKIASSEINTRAGEVVELVGLSQFTKRKPRELSGGQQQRVALARALVNRPKVLLLDEPLSALDVKLRKQMQLELKRIQRDVGVSFVFVTHDQEEAMTMSDRVAVMSKGRLEQVGSPQEIYSKPETEFVATFLGAANLLHGTFISSSAEFWKVKLANSSEILVPATGKRDGVEVTFGVRPEKISVSKPGEQRLTDTTNRIGGRVSQAVFFGVASQYQVVLTDGTEVSVYQQNFADGVSHVAGEEVELCWQADAAFTL